MIDFKTFGESHGLLVGVVIEGVPAGLKVNSEEINVELLRRQSGFGRGGRMSIEKDKAEIVSGVRWGQTIGAPVCVIIKNKDFQNNKIKMSTLAAFKGKTPPVTRPRPGHADLAGILKYDREDITDILERSSARETAARVAAGALLKKLLLELNIKVNSRVESIGGILAKTKIENNLNFGEIDNSKAVNKKIAESFACGDTLGGIIRLSVSGVPAGVGSYVSWTERLDAQISYALMSIPAIKGVEIGAGFSCAAMPGSMMHDEIFFNRKNGYFRKKNNAGGIEGGISNGSDIEARIAMKPIPTLMKPLKSVDIRTKKQVSAAAIRSDVCAVHAAAVVAEAMMAFVIARSAMSKFGGDSISETKRNYLGYIKYLAAK